MNLRTVTRGDAAVAGAALLLLISSFLPYYSASDSYGYGTRTFTANAWHSSFFPLLPSVFLLGVIAAALILLGRLLPQDPKPAGIPLGHWGTVLAVAAFWGALWSLFGGGTGTGHGFGAYLALLFSLVLAGAAVAGPLLPPLAEPLLPNAPAGAPVGPGGYPAYGQPQPGQPGQYPYPQQQFQHGEPVQQAQPGQPFTGPQAPAAPQQGGAFGHPQAAAPQAPSYGGQFGAAAPAPTPQDAPPAQYQAQAQDHGQDDQPDHATAMLTPAMKRQAAPEQAESAAQAPDLAKAEPAAAAAAPVAAAAAGSESEPSAAPGFAPFWFAVPAVRSLAPEENSGGQPVGELVPGTWYLAIAQRGDALLTQTQEGKRGLLSDTSGIQRG
ncbi:DUF5336 domain-containing protein [Streptacidiphilus cavernicola]|uniref:DUF5336 domain-containing protein n=1 Tax=Streptacidiphilus cavernicola TaxID=3342716 RepID=A0ABV6W5R8_9ACTN